MKWFHLVARSIPGCQPLADFDACAWLWPRLRRAFPEASDCVLMPNGVHLLGQAEAAELCWRTLINVLRGFSRRFGRGQRLWEPVPEPVVVRDRLHLRRSSRYVALNPSRAGLVDDPIEWLWSTYRDALGATADPWVSADRLARLLELPRQGFEQDYHGYVSADPTVAVEGTPLPRPAAAATLCRFPLQRIVLAAAAAFRVTPADALRSCQPRRLFAALALDQGWPASAVAACCRLTAAAVRRVTVSSAALAAGRLCVNDERLLTAVSAVAEPGGGPRRGLSDGPSRRHGVAGRLRRGLSTTVAGADRGMGAPSWRGRRDAGGGR